MKRRWIKKPEGKIISRSVCNDAINRKRGTCLGFSSYNDDEPIECCKQCRYIEIKED